MAGRVVKRPLMLLSTSNTTIVSKTGSVTEEYKEHVNIKRLEVRRLESIKCSRKISINTKIKVYKTMVKFILIYRREGWYKQ